MYKNFRAGDTVIFIDPKSLHHRLLYAIVEKVTDTFIDCFQPHQTDLILRIKDLKAIPWDLNKKYLSVSEINVVKKLQNDPTSLTSNRIGLRILARKARYK